MSRIELTEEFFEDEVREGFYIPACVKQAWGAQVRVLNEVDRVCKELGIKYFADWGTFLGAVRHGGFIPWDDDFDICMLRDDYLRFLDEGVKLLPEGYMVYNFENKHDHEQFVAGIVAKNRICFEEDHLERFHGFPYIAAVDVFIIDYVSPDENEQEAMRLKAQEILARSDKIRLGKGGREDKERLALDMEAEKLFASFLDKKDEAKELVQMMPWGLNKQKVMPVEYYKETVDIPFETGTIPVPLYYDAVLRVKYGDYMFMNKNAGGHDYPFFVKSRAQLQEVLDFDLPEYRLDGDEIIKKALERKESVQRSGHIKEETYKAVALECADEIKRQADRLTGAGITNDELNETCVLIQQLAIDLGTYMEAVKGEGYDMVPILEDLCEKVYELSSGAAGTPDREEKVSKIRETSYDLYDRIKRRREVLFLPFKDEYWGTMDGIYRLMDKDPDTDVCLVPIPYYYKDFKHRLHDMQYRTDKYPRDLKITKYDEYDLKLRHPDMIVIQNPYDDVNDESSVPPYFFSDRLLEHTDDLVYVPWFETYDIKRENEREYINMKHYCTVPGVVNADHILLPTRILKETYVEKLTDLAGDKTRQIWEEKILIRGTDEEREVLGVREDAAMEDNKREGKKTMVYYPDFSDIMLFGDEAVSKVRSSVKTFVDSGAALDFVIVKAGLIEDKLKELKPEVYRGFMNVLEEASRNDNIRVVVEGEIDPEKLVKECTAYYGDGGHLAHMFRNAGKPVMIQDYSIQGEEE